EHSFVIGTLNSEDQIRFLHQDNAVLAHSRVYYQRIWSETSYRIKSLRDNSDCAQEEFDAILDAKDPGLFATTTFDVNEDVAAPYINRGARPKVAILREQGVNGQIEMAAA